MPTALAQAFPSVRFTLSSRSVGAAVPERDVLDWASGPAVSDVASVLGLSVPAALRSFSATLFRFSAGEGLLLVRSDTLARCVAALLELSPHSDPFAAFRSSRSGLGEAWSNAARLLSAGPISRVSELTGALLADSVAPAGTVVSSSSELDRWLDQLELVPSLEALRAARALFALEGEPENEEEDRSC